MSEQLEPDNLDDGPDEQEPDESTLLPKPEIPDMPPEEGDDPPDEDEAVPDSEFYGETKTKDDPKIDDREFDSG